MLNTSPEIERAVPDYRDEIIGTGAAMAGLPGSRRLAGGTVSMTDNRVALVLDSDNCVGHARFNRSIAVVDRIAGAD